MKRGLAGMIYLSYICTRNSAKGELSSVGSERLPYKQRVGGSNPSAPTNENQEVTMIRDLFFLYRPQNVQRKLRQEGRLSEQKLLRCRNPAGENL